MDIEKVIAMGAQLFKDSGSSTQGLDIQSIIGAMTGLLSSGGKIDLAGLLENVSGSGLAELAQSWLGDGTNASVSAEQVGKIFSADKLSAFSGQLGLSTEDATSGLAKALPAIVDQASSAGSLIEAAGGLSGMMKMASGLFGKK
ncbi:uncharacterized protein YidB (DUF937 family) [Sinobacterium caligoides]|uniref:Uncharacterized protein YidB (DUF937 family) n=1 Tax=Sinobacterium caligoides TaxID=933926 RepID=A0A3N2DNR1_9GAMM|nr:YidB family protein [Sinobacterium caligoides]ROS01299.1 uncharacterized protein YidB (DUF937 family) [Sinobacterium caligoides]